MVEGQTYSEQLFESESFRHFVNVFLNKENGITKGCELIQTSNSIEIGQGYFVIMGGLLKENTGTTKELPNESGYYRLVYEIDLRKINTETNFEQGSYKFVKGVGNYPALTQEDLDNGGNVYQFEFCQFRITEVGIQDYVDKRTFLDFDNIYKEIRRKIDEIEKEGIFVTKNMISIATATVKDSKIATNEMSKFSLSEIKNQIGEKFKIENGGIKIGEGITQVLVSAQSEIPFHTGELVEFAIYKNNLEVAKVVLNDRSAFQHSTSITDKLIEVKEGDVISMYVKGNGVQFSADENLTYLTLKSFN